MELSKYLAGGRLQRLVLKELRESLRDRRTVVTLVLMPILVYPLLGMVLQRLLLSSATEKPNESFIIGIAESDRASEIDRLLFEAQTLINSGANTLIAPRDWTTASEESHVDADPKPNAIADNSEQAVTAKQSDQAQRETLETVPNVPRDPKQKDAPKFDLVLVQDSTLQRALDRGSIDVAISSIERRDDGPTSVPEDRQRAASQQLPLEGFSVELLYRRGDVRSEEAAVYLRRMCQLINDQQLRFLLQSINPRFEPAVVLKATGIGKPPDPAASIAAVIPLVLILMTITGAVYPAIDLTAGERERGTMEAMIATPAPRFALLLSKYFAVVTVSVLTALANLFATWMTLSFGGLGKAIFGEAGFGLNTLLQILPILIIFAGFFSSILLALCSFAKTFKEAQAYLIPVMLVSLAPGLVTLMPSIEFTSLLAVVPLLNVLLLSRDIMTGVPPLLPAIIAIITTVAYGAASLVIASHLFGAANSMTSNQGSWKELLRGPAKPSPIPDVGSFAIYLAMLFPVLFVVSSMSSLFAGQIQLLMGLNAISLLVLFLVLPILWVRLRRGSIPKTFLLSSRCTEAHLEDIGNSQKSVASYTRLFFNAAGVMLLAATLWIFALEGVLLFKSWSLSSLVPDMEKVKTSWMAIPFSWILLTQAIAPAIAEEFFFRGFAISAFRTKLRVITAVLLSALLFGLFHVISGNVLSMEKFLPTFLLGLVLGYVAVATKSIWYGVLLHACHNALVLWFSRQNKEFLEQWFGEGEHMPPQILIAAAVGLICGLAMIMRANRADKQSHEISEQQINS